MRGAAQHSKELPSNRSHNPSSYRILLGYNQLSKPTNYSLMMTVHKLIVHEDYNKYHRMSNDIVLMQLHRPVEFSSQVLPACLPDADLQLDPFTSCWITGWGMLTENSEHTGQGKGCGAGRPGSSILKKPHGSLSSALPLLPPNSLIFRIRNWVLSF